MIGRLLRHWQNASTQSSPRSPEPQREPAAALDRYDIALRDLSESGWFNPDTGELYPHFPIAKDDVVLDVGCGRGGMMAFCARQGARIILTDIERNELAGAVRMLNEAGAKEVTAIVSDSDPLPLPDSIASKVVCCEVLEHVDDPVNVLNELARVGCSGSLYLLTVPDPVAEGLQKQLAPSLYFEKPNHLRIFGRDEFPRMVTDAGLEILHRGAGGFYSALWWQFFWTTGVPLSNPSHPLLDSWSDTWRALLATPDGMRVKKALDAFMPMYQSVVARKP